MVHDNRGVARYCVGVQLEPGADSRRFGSARACLAILFGEKAVVSEEITSLEESFIAVGKRPSHTVEAPDLRSAVRFWNGHIHMLKEIDAYDPTSVSTPNALP